MAHSSSDPLNLNPSPLTGFHQPSWAVYSSSSSSSSGSSDPSLDGYHFLGWPDSRYLRAKALVKQLDLSCKVELVIHNAKVHISTDRDGLSDPYVKIYDSQGTKVGETKVKSNTLEPEWEENFELRIEPENLPLAIIMYDKDLVGKSHIGGGLIHVNCEKGLSYGALYWLSSDEKKLHQKRSIQIGKSKLLKKHADEGTKPPPGVPEDWVHGADLVYTLRPRESR